MPVIRKPGFMNPQLELLEFSPESGISPPSYLELLQVTRSVLEDAITPDVWKEMTGHVSDNTKYYFFKRGFMRFPALCCLISAKAVEAVTGLEAIGGTCTLYPEDIGHYWNRDPANGLYVDLALDPFVEEDKRRDVYIIKIKNPFLQKGKLETGLIKEWDGSVKDSSGKEIINVGDIASEVRSRHGLYT